MNGLFRLAAPLVALLLPLPVSSQAFPPGFVDAGPLLRAAADFYGADGVRCIQIATPSGVALNQAAAVGQGRYQRETTRYGTTNEGGRI